MCATVWFHLVNATEVTACLAESNGSLPPSGWLKVTCGLTACTPGSAAGPALSNEYGRTLPLPFTYYTGLVSDDLVSEDQFSEAGDKFADLSPIKHTQQQQQQRQDVKNLKEQTEEQPSIVVSGTGVCCFAVV